MEPTENQIRIANALNIDISNDDTFRILKAKIEDEIADSIGMRKRENPTYEQIEYAKSLSVIFKKESLRLLSAKIGDELERQNVIALKKLNLKKGDIVVKKDKYDERNFVVSTVKCNGKIYFKGIGCQQAWASQIDRVIERS